MKNHGIGQIRWLITFNTYPDWSFKPVRVCFKVFQSTLLTQIILSLVMILTADHSHFLTDKYK